MENQFFAFSKEKLNFVIDILCARLDDEVCHEYTRFVASFEPETASSYGIEASKLPYPIDDISNWKEIKESYQGPSV